MEKKYESIGIFPLEFPDGQQVEAGEAFTRDFEKTTGVEHEQWLIGLGHIRLVPDMTAAPPARPVLSRRVEDPKE